MYQNHFIVFLLFYFTLSEGKQFRSDYTYRPSVDGWTKLHQLPQTWAEARLWCHYEGSVLASPTSFEMQSAMMEEQNLRGQQQSRQNAVTIFTGISANYSEGVFFSEEGVPLDKIPVTWAPLDPENKEMHGQCIAMYPNGEIAVVNCNDPRPFICFKKNSTDIPEMNECGTVDPEYTLDHRTGHCYKVHRFGLTWPEAFKACAAEGGYLAIINSADESRALKELMAKYPSKVVMAFYKDFFGVGFRDWGMKGTHWTTIHGQTLEEAGFERWNGENPNSSTGTTWPWRDEHCGVVLRPGSVGDIHCDLTVPFICEMEPVETKEAF